MANILLLTNIYPITGIKLYGTTAVCEYFVKEWVKQGHNVKIIYNYSIYTPFLHFISKYFGKSICNVFPTIINSIRFNKPYSYQIDGADVLLNPIYKPFPKLQFKTKYLNKNINIGIEWIDKLNFKPNVIVGHFLHPSLQIVPAYGTYYKCRTAIIVHGKYNPQRDKDILLKYGKDIDSWGFRSYPIKSSFEQILGTLHPRKKFMCFSGVPEGFICAESILKHTSAPPKSLIFVGNLIKRKHPIEVVKAFKNVFVNPEDRLCFVGHGKLEKEILNYAKSYNIIENIQLKGRLLRSEVRKMLINHEIFVMISSDETFGLVYLEAMACGCIVIGSSNEGMDGIIKDGENGFLCKAGDDMELTRILEQIHSLHFEERLRIAQNAIETAKKMSDYNMAQLYLESLQIQ